MINIKRSYPAPKSLELEKNKSSGTYNKEDVIERLYNDFCGKCYLCESHSTSYQVEHLKPHKGDVNLKFDWENLFLSCSHCNNTKLDKYDNILDCTKENVEEKIRYEINAFPKLIVNVFCIDKDNETADRTNKTVELLTKCYNGQTPLKRIDCINIKNQILEEVLIFQRFIKGYFDSLEECNLVDIKYFEKKIIQSLSKKSKYTSFKRWIIKDDDNLFKVFGKYLKD